MCKVKNGLAPPYFADLFVVTSSQYHLRNSDFTIPRFRTVAYGIHRMIYLGRVIWPRLDRSIRSSESLGIFKWRVKLVNLTSLLESTCKECFLCSKYILWPSLSLEKQRLSSVTIHADSVSDAKMEPVKFKSKKQLKMPF